MIAKVNLCKKPENIQPLNIVIIHSAFDIDI